jgi:hypothetical protein
MIIEERQEGACAEKQDVLRKTCSVYFSLNGSVNM